MRLFRRFRHATAGFEFMQKLGIQYFCFHDVDIVPGADDIKETNRRLDEISDYILEKMKGTGIKCLWGAANMFGNPRFNAPIFCVNDYVCWTAPVDDLSDWRYEGVIYKKTQDPKNKMGLRLLFAPDVVRGVHPLYFRYTGTGYVDFLWLTLR